MPSSCNRRSLLQGLALSPFLLSSGALSSAALSAVADSASAASGTGRAGATYSKRVRDFVGEALVIDMLAPLLLDRRPQNWAGRLSPEMAAAFRASGITVFHNSSGILGPDAYTQALDYFATWNGFVARNSDVFTGVHRSDDFLRAKKDGKIAVMMGVQNSEHFRTPEDVAHFHDLGQRCSQLTYNTQNLLGAGGTERVDGGLSDYGLRIVEEMNKVGMLVDLSHCGDRTTLDAIEFSKKPVAITHSNCRALNDHPRLKTDEAIRKLATKGGVMGITGVRMFVSGTEPTTIETMVDHIDHVVRLVGIDHVGIGSDADLHGYDALPPDQVARLRAAYKSSYGFRDRIDIAGFDHPRKMFDLTDALLRRGYGADNIRQILGGNFHRLLKETIG